jgi:UDP-GlcNAc3NAcA epimerase
MLMKIEQEILSEEPDWLLVYGDTNSTLAGALAAAKLHIKVCHVEAGLRSFNKRMPEEINRIMTDHVSDLLFVPTATAIRNLQAENITGGVHHTGDIMYDAALRFGEVAENSSDILDQLEIKPGSYLLATVHRQENTDEISRLKGIFRAFDELASGERPLILPLHPRTNKMLEHFNIKPTNENVRLIKPVGFLEFIKLEKNAHTILTDSGGIQKEAYFHGIPCITMREETEWVETIEAGWNQLAGAETKRICEAFEKSGNGNPILEYGEGKSAEQMIRLLRDHY